LTEQFDGNKKTENHFYSGYCSSLNEIYIAVLYIDMFGSE